MSRPASSSAPRCPRVLITGAAGFVGRHLAAELSTPGHTVLTTDLGDAPELPEFRPTDLRDRAATAALIRETRPDACVHLAAVSFVPDGDRDPSALLTINIGGTVNLLEALRAEAPKARLLLVSTSQVYGPAASLESAEPPPPIAEDAPCLPLSLYAISKAACERAACGYAAAFGLDVMIARPANHTGPGQSPRFVAAAFAQQVRDVAEGRSHEIVVGNLDSIRDFTDVRDVVRAYRLLIEQGTAGLVYNISAHHRRVRIGDLLGRLQALAGVRAHLRVDPARVRPTDASIPLDVSRLQEATGWNPAYTLDDTLRDLLA